MLLRSIHVYQQVVLIWSGKGGGTKILYTINYEKDAKFFPILEEFIIKETPSFQALNKSSGKQVSFPSYTTFM